VKRPHIDRCSFARRISPSLFCVEDIEPFANSVGDRLDGVNQRLDL
jgi:hypothetical protein